MIELTVSLAESKDTARENCFEKNRKKSTGFAVGREQGTYAGVKYSIKQDMTFSYNGYKVVTTNLTPEMIQRIISLSE